MTPDFILYDFLVATSMWSACMYKERSATDGVPIKTLTFISSMCQLKKKWPEWDQHALRNALYEYVWIDFVTGCFGPNRKFVRYRDCF